jgi:dTDP-4-amino-4,6-dideoxygalactose transaminase
MHDVAAAVGIHQLARLDGWIERRRELAECYDARLAGLPLEIEPPLPEDARHAHHLYIVRLSREAAIDRDLLAFELRARNIGTSVHFRAIHLHSYYRDRYGLTPHDLPVASDWSARALSLPMFPTMDAGDVEDVALALEALLS